MFGDDENEKPSSKPSARGLWFILVPLMQSSFAGEAATMIGNRK